MKNQIADNIKKERAKRLRELGEKLKYKFIKKQRGKVQNILVEKDNKGYTENYIQVQILGEKITPNTIVKAKIVKVSKDCIALAKRI